MVLVEGTKAHKRVRFPVSLATLEIIAEMQDSQLSLAADMATCETCGMREIGANRKLTPSSRVISLLHTTLSL